ncbi:MAG: hypothetical protein ACFBSE_26330 [Prochloraceae cyanobacterium]
MSREIERLEIRIGFIRQQIDRIHAEGIVAPARTWIQKYYVKKSNGKKYWYYRLLEACERRSKTGSIQGRVKLYLGNKHSSKYKTYKEAIRRRNELKWLEKRYKELLALFEKAVSQLVGKGIYSEQSSETSEKFDRLEDRSSTERDRPNQELKNSTQIKEAFNLAIAAAEKLENAEEVLWHCLEEIGFRLGLRIDRVDWEKNGS